MHYLTFLYPVLLASSAFFSGGEALRSGQKIKLSNVQSLTLRKGLETSHRRVPALPQLKCIGGSAKGLYEVDVMRCKNSGYDYNEEDIQWTCTASLPEEFKLGSTDVICEGYDSPNDPYILKGSCGVEYRLVLTSKGEEKYGKKRPWHGDDGGHYSNTLGEKVAAAIFWLLFIGVAVWIAYSAFCTGTRGNEVVGGANHRPGWGGGGGGGGGYGGPQDPPPPYDWRPSPKPSPSYGATDGWRPGFWSGALGGAAAGYAAGRSGNRDSQNRGSGGGGSSWWNNGEGNSRSGSSGSSGSNSSARYESTGFGSTSRR
ncbi:DUF1183-domain-containing protein [Lindgomyces ingoldianus]|uniref:DUF1183-domain-containing protein n=1 Tax=Lindgomyces ingoldianus TaxID=673940 RepID=A0ACB6R4N8_9PLEO|nr:DUF1183-domain-containing protein [Lindgomyces ingoldianus]KAF2474116.1 DUF1183-domain-containing protein [Lindgomyces ingoldianus]